MHRGLKATYVIFSKLSFTISDNFMKRNLTESSKILETLILARCLNLVQSSWRLASLLQNHSRKSVGHGVRLSASLCMENNGRFLDTKINLMVSSNLHIFWWMYKVYMQVLNFCKLYGNQDGFYGANAWTDISGKLKIKLTLTWWRCINSLYIMFPPAKCHVYTFATPLNTRKKKDGKLPAAQKTLSPSHSYASLCSPDLMLRW